jgi:hypothetical protein
VKEVSQNHRVTVSEIAQLSGVSVSAVSNWRKRYPDFPAPNDASGAGDLFALQDVLVWLERRGKTVRKPKEQGLHQLFAGMVDALRNEGLPSESLLLAVLQVLTLWRALSVEARDLSGGSSRWSDLLGASSADLPQLWARVVDTLDVQANDAVREVLTSPSVSWRGVERLIAAVERVAADGMRDVNSATFGEAVSRMLAELQDSQVVRVFGASTPRSLTSLMVRLLLPMDGVVYDPAAGHAMVLAEAARAAQGELAQVIGQEISEYSWRVGVLHLALCGLPSQLARGDTLLHDAFRGVRADRIILDPPLGQRLSAGDYVLDPRWEFGTSNYADWMWAQHLLAHLEPHGIGAILLPMGALFRGGRDAEIRAGLVRAGELDVVIALPSGLIAGTSIPLALILFDRTRVRRDGEVLFIDAGQLGSARRGRVNDLSPDDINQIATYVRWWRDGKHISVPTFAAVASRDTILSGPSVSEGGYPPVDLTPNRFIQYPASNPDDQIRNQLSDLDASVDSAALSLRDAANLEQRVRTAVERLGATSTEYPLRRLRDVLEMRPINGGRQDLDGDEDPRPWVSPKFIASSRGRIAQAPADLTRGKRRLREARRGDLLLVSRGIDTSSEREVCAIVDVDMELAFSDSLLLLTPKRDLLDPEYLRYAITSNSGLSALAAVASGTVIANLRPEALMEVEIRLPPLDVQRLTVETLRAVENASERLASATQQVSDLFSLLRNGATAGLLAPGESLEVLAESPSSRDPLTYPVGVLVEGQADAPRGHHWFRNDREAMEWYLDAHVIPTLTRRRAQDELSAVQYARNWAEKRGFGLALTVSSINAATAPLMSVSWIGTFDELRGGATPHARYLCAEYWEAMQDDGSFRKRCRPEEDLEEQSGIFDKDVDAFISMIKALDGK